MRSSGRLRDGASERHERSRLPEAATRDRRTPGAVRRPVPVEDEVHPTPVALLHIEDEVEQPFTPAQRPGEPRRVPDVAVHLERPSGVVDARDTFIARLPRVDRHIDGIRIDRNRDCTLTGGRDVASQPGNLPQHGRIWSMMSRTRMSAAARQLSAAP